MKKYFMAGFLLLAVFLFGGCGVKAYLTIDEQGVSKEEMYYYDDEKIDELSSIYIGDETVNGKSYQKYKLDTAGEGMEDGIFEGSDVIIKTPTSFRVESRIVNIDTYDMDSSVDLSSWDFYDITVTMPQPVTVTNGILSEDGKTVTFDLKNPLQYLSGSSCVIYAYTASATDVITREDTLELKGLNKYDSIRNPKTLKVKSYSEILSVMVNGKEYASKEIKISKQGKYVIKIRNHSKTKKYVVWYDKGKPTTTVQPMTYQGKVKIKYKDSVSGVFSALLDKKPIKNGYVCSKKGKHKLVITDNAGNRKTVRFRIL